MLCLRLKVPCLSPSMPLKPQLKPLKIHVSDCFRLWKKLIQNHMIHYATKSVVLPFKYIVA